MSENIEPRRWKEIYECPEHTGIGVSYAYDYLQFGDLRVYDKTVYVPVGDGWLTFEEFIRMVVREELQSNTLDEDVTLGDLAGNGDTRLGDFLDDR